MSMKKQPPVQDSPLPVFSIGTRAKRTKQNKTTSIIAPNSLKCHTVGILASSHWRGGPWLYRSSWGWEKSCWGTNTGGSTGSEWVEPAAPRATFYYPSETQSSRLFCWNMNYYLWLQDTHLNLHGFKQPPCEYLEWQGTDGRVC